MSDNSPTLWTVMQAYLDMKRTSRGAQTARCYKTGIKFFCGVLEENNLHPMTDPAGALSEDAIGWLIAALAEYSTATEMNYIAAISGLYEYLASENYPVNLARVRTIVRQRARKIKRTMPRYPRKELDTFLDYIAGLKDTPIDNQSERLRNLRDRALIFTLADTGLRIHEAINLSRGDIDYDYGISIVKGKGGDEAPVRFSTRALGAIHEYLQARATLDGATGKPLAGLPLFARHDKGAGRRVKRITTTTGRNIVTDRAVECFGDNNARLHPHLFRHRFVTHVLDVTGNLKIAQELARHKNIAITQMYAHPADKEIADVYRKAFEQ